MNYFKYLASLLLFGSNGVIASYIDLTSYEIVFLRSAFGTAFLIAIFFISKRRLTVRQNPKDAVFIALSGIAMGVEWMLLFEAYAQLGVSLGVIINYSGPAIVIAFSVLFLKEKITSAKLISLIAAFTGVLLISGQTAETAGSLRGLCCAVLSAFTYAAMVILNRKATKITGLENATLQLFFALITIGSFVFFKQGFYMEIAAGDLLPVLWLGLINTGVGCYLYFSTIGKLPVQTVAICGYLEPLSAAVLSALILHEALTPLQLVGVALIIGGAIFSECYKNP